MNSLHEFLYMGGYAAYVWPAFGIVTIVMIANVIIARRRHRKTIEDIRRANEPETRGSHETAA